ncbi:hypothetical protein ScPMuIL_008609 [Solemya velum]
MVSRVLRLRYLGGAVFAAAPLITYKVHASDGEETTGKRMKISQLPIYANPEDGRQYEFVDEEIGRFQQSVSDVRTVVWNYLDSMQDTIDLVKDKWGIAKAHTTELVTYVQEDPGVLPKAGVITIAGLGGIVAGYRGGFMKKSVYSSLAMLGAASLCYPKEAVDISSKGYDRVVSQAMELWEGPSEKTNQADTKHVPEKVDSNPKNESLGDVGQSKKEDADLYTTRSS